MSALLEVGTGAVGRVAQSPRTRTRPDLCVEHDHPGVTYNPWRDRTWCLCGERIYDGDVATHADCCGGPLVEAVTS